MASTTLLGATIRHNGGTILQAGNVSGKTKNLSTTTNLYKTVYSSKLNETNANSGLATRPLSGGDYGKMTKGRFIASYLTGGYIAGVANTAISRMARDPSMKTIHKVQQSRKYANVSWNAVTGALTKGGTAGNSFNFIDPAVAGGATASADSGSPVSEWTTNGHLFFMSGGKTPGTYSYSVRKG